MHLMGYLYKSNKSELQSLTGLLLYIHKCVKLARLFVNRILSTLRGAPDKGYVSLDQGFAKDITWFNQFLSQFNGSVCFYKELQPPITTMYLDACLTVMGGCWNNQVYALPNTHLVDIHDKTIVHLEMVNILVALRLWGKQLQHFKLILNSDNEAIVHMLQSGRGRDQFLLAVARNVWLITSTMDIHLAVQHIPGKANAVEDLLSRWHISSLNRAKLHDHIENPLWLRCSREMAIVDNSI